MILYQILFQNSLKMKQQGMVKRMIQVFKQL